MTIPHMGTSWPGHSRWGSKPDLWEEWLCSHMGDRELEQVTSTF